MKFKTVRLALAAGLVAASVVAPAMAAGIDVSDAISNISAAVTTVSALGVAGLSVVVAAKVFKWVRAAL